MKFDNTAGDNSVEVEYGDDANFAPSSPPPPQHSHTRQAQASSTTPGRGPTGRTPNQVQRQAKQQQGRGSRSSGSGGSKHGGRGSKSSRDPNKGRPHSSGSLGGEEESWNSVPLKEGLLPTPGHRVRSTSSQSQSHGDSEEWEDCTGSSGVPEDEEYIHGGQAPVYQHHGPDGLHLEVKLNPDAPEFLPTSPDFMKTPPGHVKVLNWASDGNPLSPPVSQGSGPTSPRYPATAAANTSLSQQSGHSTASSPGSSASTKAANRREVADSMPEADEPFQPPPEVMMAMMSQQMEHQANADTSSRQADGPGISPSMAEKQVLEEDDDDDDKFEDSIDEAPAPAQVQDVKQSKVR